MIYILPDLQQPKPIRLQKQARIYIINWHSF